MEFTGIEEYPNIFEKEYCEEIIKHFNVMAQREVVRPITAKQAVTIE